MFKVAILGCENSHAISFLKYVIEDKDYDDIEFVGVYSDDAEAAQKLNERFGVYVAKSYDEFVGKVDGIMVTARHGKDHLKFARPYLESGIPIFIDKPITITEVEARELIELAQKYNVRLSGGSALKYADGLDELKDIVKDGSHGRVFGGYFRAPGSLYNIYGDFFFYTQHNTTMMCEIFGYYPNSVFVANNDEILTCTVRYDACDVVLQYSKGSSCYYAAVSTENDFCLKQLTLDNVFEREFAEYHDLLCGAEQKESYNDFIAQVFILNAIDRSIKSGKEEKVNRA